MADMAKPVISPEVIEQVVLGIPHCHAMGVGFVSVSPGHATLSLPWREDLVGDPESGVLAGGVVTSLIDTVCGMAVWSSLTRFMQIATLDLRIDYLRPATKGALLHASAHCYKVTRSVAFVRSTAFHPDKPDDLVATCVGAFMLDSTASRQARNSVPA